jgi:ABC-2 type transport system permease protein
MDNRKIINPAKANKTTNYSLWLQYLFFGFFGIMSSIVIADGGSVYVSLFISFSFLMFMLSVNLISDFSTVLFDTRDNTVIIPRPVSETTYLFAKVIHITSYILGFAMAYSVVPFVIILLKFNALAASVFFVNVLLSAIFAVFFTHLLYLGLMRIFSGERFKDIIAYFQIFITIFTFGGYQIFIRLTDKLAAIKFSPNHWWLNLLPPSWMAGSNEFFTSFNVTWFSLLSIALAWIVPVGGLLLIVKVLAPGYTKKMAILEQGDTKKIKTLENKKTFSFSSFLSKIFTRTPLEAAAFQVIWKIAGRDRKFKQTIYPMLGSMVVLVFMILFTGRGRASDSKTSMSFLVFLYFPLLFIYSLIQQLKYTDNFRSAWIYKVMPISRPGEIVSATIKAISLKLFVPAYLACNAVVLYYRGIEYFPHIVVGFLLTTIIAVGLFSISKFSLPFTSDYVDKNTGNNMATTFILLPIGAAAAGLHFCLIWLNVNILLVAAVLAVAYWFVFKAVRKTNWNRIEAFEV